MLVDCVTCEVRGVACGDCVLTVLWGLPEDESASARARVVLDADERRALRVLADAGLAPRLRHVGDPARPGGRRAG